MDGARRFNSICCGRRWGKSTLGMDLALDLALDGKRVAYFEPTYKMLAEVWRELSRQLPPPLGKPSSQDHRIDLVTGGVIELWSLDNPDSSRGRAYHRVIVDEAAMVPLLLDAWQHVLRPTLTDFAGDAWFLSTPRGFNDFKTLYDWGADAAHPLWAAFRAPSSDNPHIPAAEIEQARRELSPAAFGQEYLADFLSDARAVFPSICYEARVPVATPPELPQETIVYRLPNKAHRYLLGADVSQGLPHGDRSCCVVLEVDEIGNAREAAHLCGLWPTDIFGGMLDILAQAYHGRLGVERNNHGHAVLDGLRRMRAGRRESRYVLHTDQPVGKHPTMIGAAQQSGTAGWLTTTASKPLMVNELEEALRNEYVTVHTRAMVDELRGYQYDDQGRTSAPEGQHDDTVMALAIAWQMRKWAQSRGQRQLKVSGLNG